MRNLVNYINLFAIVFLFSCQTTENTDSDMFSYQRAPDWLSSDYKEYVDQQLPNSSVNETEPLYDDIKFQLKFEEIDKGRIFSGECTILLWARNSIGPYLIAKVIQNNYAMLKVNGRNVRYDFKNQSGAIVNDIYAKHKFASDDVELDFRFILGLPFKSGVYVERGLIIYKDSSNQTASIPVAGIAGC